MADSFQPDSFQPDDTSLASRDARVGAINNAVSTGALEGLKTALPSPSALLPIQPTGNNPYTLGIEGALQTLRDPSRISPTISLPGQAASESNFSQQTQKQLEQSTGIPQPVSKFVEQALLDPQTYLGMTPGEIPEGMQKQLASLGETLSGVDRRNFLELANNPSKVLSSEPSSFTGKIFQQAKERAGVTAEDERSIATKEDFRRNIYNTVLGKIDDASKPELSPAVKVGDNILTGNAHSEIAPKAAQIQLEGLQKGQNLTPTSGFIDKEGQFVNLDDLQNKISDYGDNPFAPSKPDVSVADLLKAKKAGQLMAKSDNSTSGFFYNEINNKINPLLKQMAPEVYEAQQATHLSKVKESFQNIFPQGQGYQKYIRTIGMLAGSLFHGVGALESPAVAGALTLAGSQGAKVALSPATLFTGSKLLKGFPLNQTSPDSFSALQSLRDRMNNQ